VVKKFGRDKPIQVVIHMCMEAILGISLYSHPYLKLVKTLCHSYYCLCILFYKIGEDGRTDANRKSQFYVSSWAKKGI
jgi:hypothetical protein